MVQHSANRRRENRLDMEDLQARANPCNTLLSLVAGDLRSQRFESARQLTEPKPVVLATAVVWRDFYIST